VALLQISEPGQSLQPHQRKYAVGIDLGTTNSLVATVRSGSAEILTDEQGRELLPSVVHYMTEGSSCVGYKAMEHKSSDPGNTVSSIKRLMGRGLSDIETLANNLPYQFVADGSGVVPKVKTAHGLVSPVQVSAEILGKLVERAEMASDSALDGAVITVPAYFDDAQRQATKDAATLAGIKVLRLLNEPTAAAVAYGLDQIDTKISDVPQQDRLITVYDLGGGTFDVSILRLSGGVFKVLATGGDSALGGDDFDSAIADWFRQQLCMDQALSSPEKCMLLETARYAKESLTHATQISLDIFDATISLSRETLHKLVDALIDKTLRSCKQALRDSGVKKSQIDDLILVGGSTRMPRVAEKVGNLFNLQPKCNINPDQVVAMGAAIQAEVLIGNQFTDSILLLDVIPLSLSIETMGGLTEKIIHRNTTIPISKSQEFTTFKDGQTAMSIHVMQGERELAADCRSLARFELRGIPPMVAGSAKIRVTYQVDTDGLLSVSALELTSGVKTTIEVKPSYGLDEQEITRMLQDSTAHARDDMCVRALKEQQIEAERMVEDLRGALRQDGANLLNEEERKCLKNAIEELQQLRQISTDHRQLARQIEALGKASETFAARRMDFSIKRALAGRSLDQALE
jgi:molecular chaperone HscA